VSRGERGAGDLANRGRKNGEANDGLLDTREGRNRLVLRGFVGA